MNKNILIIKNITHERPGLILEILNEYEFDYEIIDLSKRIEFPEIDKYKLIIIMGGPDSANDNSEKILKELDYIKKALKREIPIFGVCLGLQLMIKALGGDVYKNPVKEIGFKQNDEWNTIKLTKEGLIDPIFEGITNEFKAFHLHGETVKLTNEMAILAIGKFCQNQIIKFREKNYGFQFHFEIIMTMLNEWVDKASELKGKNISNIIKEFELIKDDYISRGKKIFTNYLKLIQFL
ncbi:MAG: type 1 glutamine amidotransferase [Promethearchaeota archaeon]